MAVSHRAVDRRDAAILGSQTGGSISGPPQSNPWSRLPSQRSRQSHKPRWPRRRARPGGGCLAQHRRLSHDIARAIARSGPRRAVCYLGHRDASRLRLKRSSPSRLHQIIRRLPQRGHRCAAAVTSPPPPFSLTASATPPPVAVEMALPPPATSISEMPWLPVPVAVALLIAPSIAKDSASVLSRRASSEVVLPATASDTASASNPDAEPVALLLSADSESDWAPEPDAELVALLVSSVMIPPCWVRGVGRRVIRQRSVRGIADNLCAVEVRMRDIRDCLRA